MRTRVVDVRGRLHEYGPRLEHAPADLVRVGRRWTMGGWDLPKHPVQGHDLRPRPVPAARAGVVGEGVVQGAVARPDAGLLVRARAVPRGRAGRAGRRTGAVTGVS